MGTIPGYRPDQSLQLLVCHAQLQQENRHGQCNQEAVGVPEMIPVKRPQTTPMVVQQKALKCYMPKDFRWTPGLSRLPYLNQGEMEMILAVANTAQTKHTMIEIGVNSGRTARMVLDHIEFQRYIGIDVLPGYSSKLLPVQRREVPGAPGRHCVNDRRFELLVSANGSGDIKVGELPPADVIFIDGDHSARGVTHDTELALAAIKPGGTIIWHDYHDMPVVQVKPVIDKLVSQGRTIFRVEGTWIAFERFP
jgi:hypothetical protein